MSIKGARDYDGPSQEALDSAKEIAVLDGQTDQHKWLIGDDMVAKVGPAGPHGVNDGSGKEVYVYLQQLNEAAGTEHKLTSARNWRTTATRWPEEIRDLRKPWSWHHLLNGVPQEERAAALRKVRTTADARKLAKEYRTPPARKSPEDRVVAAVRRLRTVEQMRYVRDALNAMLARADGGSK